MRHDVMEIMMKDVDHTIRNPRTIDWSKFDWASGYIIHTVNSTDILKPYLISFKYYDDVDYEDIILLLNKIDNPFDLRPGAQLRIPNRDDIDNFIVENRV